MGQIDWLAAQSAAFPSAPVWHPAEKRIYWSDVPGRRLFATEADTGITETVLDDGSPVGAVVPQADGSLLLFRDQGCIISFRDGAVRDTVLSHVQELRQTRFACAAADPTGRIVCAVLSDFRHPARIFLLDRNGHLSLLFEATGIPSGLAFAESGAALLVANSYATRANVVRFPFDATSPTPILTGASTLIDTLTDNARTRGTPAGIAVAADGSIMVARIDGSAVCRHSPDGGRLGSFSVHVRRPVGLCFGGDGLHDLFVTTAGAHRMAIDGAHAGEIAVFRGFQVAGAPVFASRIGLPDATTAAAAS